MKYRAGLNWVNTGRYAHSLDSICDQAFPSTTNQLLTEYPNCVGRATLPNPSLPLTWALSLSVLMDILLDDPGLASLWKQRMMEVVVTTGAISRAKLQSIHHHQQTNTQCFTGRMLFLSPNQQCQSNSLSLKWAIVPNLVVLHQTVSAKMGSKNSPSGAPPHRCFLRCSKPKNWFNSVNVFVHMKTHRQQGSYNPLHHRRWRPRCLQW